MSDVRAVIVMPYEEVREALTLLFGAMSGLEIVAQGRSASEAADLVRRHVPDVVILDVDRGRVVQTIDEIREAGPRAQVLVTVDDSARSEIERHFGSGLDDVSIRAVSPGELFAAVRLLLTRRRDA